MRKHIGKILALTATTLLTLSAIAADRKIVLKFYDEHMRGENTIAIKREIRNQHPGINLRRFEIQQVVLVAKSKKGGGKAMLQVGYDQTRRQIIDGTPYDFHDSDAYTFHRVRLDNPSYDGSEGSWKLHLKGNLIVRKVIVKLNRGFSYEPTPQPTGRIRFQEVDSLRVSKFIESTERVYVDQRRVKAIKLKAERNPVEILSVEVVFENGRRKMLRNLTGYIYEGDAKTVKFKELKNVSHLRITAVSPSAYGSRGELSVLVGKQRR